MASSSSSSSFFSPSFSSPMENKTAKISQNALKKLSSSSKATSLIKRQVTVFKKAYELSTLCGIEVCVICYGPDGELKTWPEDREKVKDMARRYTELSETRRRKGSVNLCEFLKKINEDDSNKKKKVRLGSDHKYPDWDPRFNNFSVEQLMALVQSLEHNLARIQHRARVVVEVHKQRNMQNMNMADQEQTTMNHLQQYPNPVSLYLYNHGKRTFSKIPVPSSAFNQSQSLAPIPNSLRIYQDPNMENYSRLLGGEVTGMNEFQNTTNMSTYYNNNSVDDLSKEICYGLPGVQETGINEFGRTNTYSCNINVGENSGLLGAQDIGINGLQNMDMYGYKNNNVNTDGLSHQLVQYATQTAAPVSRFWINPETIL